MVNVELTSKMHEAFKVTIPALLGYEVDIDDKVIIVKPKETTFFEGLTGL